MSNVNLLLDVFKNVSDDYYRLLSQLVLQFQQLNNQMLKSLWEIEPIPQVIALISALIVARFAACLTTKHEKRKKVL